MACLFFIGGMRPARLSSPITMIVQAMKRRFVKAQVHKLLLPRHVREIALAIDALSERNETSQVHVERTSLDVLMIRGNHGVFHLMIHDQK